MIDKNPPLLSYYLAAAGSLFGWGERALHAAMLLPALGLVFSIRAIGQQLTRSPLLVAGLAWSTPLALVSSTTLMVDVPMLALFCASLACWLRGTLSARARDFAWAGGFASLAFLTKYFALALLPIFLAHVLALRCLPGPSATGDGAGAAEPGQRGRWWLALALPLATALAYGGLLHLRYGFDPLRDLGAYSLGFEATRVYAPWERALVALAFVGGGAVTTLLLAPLLWSRRATLGGLLAIALGGALLASRDHFGVLTLEGPFAERAALAAQLALMIGAGFHLLGLAAAEVRTQRDATAWLLALWLVGVIVHTAFFNWTPTARVALPALPCAALLAVRRLERNGPPGRARSLGVGLALGTGLVLALWTAWADARFADSARTAARDLFTRYAAPRQRTTFQAAWGFMYYLEQLGAERLDFTGSTLRRGDIVFVPHNNTNALPLPADSASLVETVDYPLPTGIATLSKRRGAGFHAALWGPLPFAFGSPEPERYYVVRIQRTLHTDEIIAAYERIGTSEPEPDLHRSPAQREAAEPHPNVPR